MRGSGSIPTGDNIFHWIFCFHIVKPMLPILALLPTLFNYGKPRLKQTSWRSRVIHKHTELAILVLVALLCETKTNRQQSATSDEN